MINKINIVYGTTASGKSAYALDLAKKINGVIINSDCMQVYKEIPILTAQPTIGEKSIIPHLLYGYFSCLEKYSVHVWLKDVIPIISSILADGKTPILVGGTGMYIKFLIEGIINMPSFSNGEKQKFLLKYQHIQNEPLHNKLSEVDPKLAAKYKINDRQRILRALEVFELTHIPLSSWQQKEPKSFFKKDDFNLIFIDRDRNKIYQRINKRFDNMLEQGVIEEVRSLYAQAADSPLPPAHGLPEIINFLNGDLTLEEAIDKAKRITRNYAKRQLTWARHQFKNILNQTLEHL